MWWTVEKLCVIFARKLKIAFPVRFSTSGWNCEPVVCTLSGPFEASFWLAVGLLFFSYCIFKKTKHKILHTHLPTFEDARWRNIHDLEYTVEERSSIRTFQFKCQGMKFRFCFFFYCCGFICVRIYYELIFICPFLDHCLVMVKGFEKLHKSMSPAIDMKLSKFWEMAWDRQAWHGALHGVAMSWMCLGDWTIISIWILMWIEVSIILFFFFFPSWTVSFLWYFPLSVSASIFSLFLFINMGLTAICFEVIFCLILLRIYLGNIHI